MKTLRWPKGPGAKEMAPHELRLIKQHEGTKLLLLIEKPGECQNLVLNLPEIAPEAVVAAWKGAWESYDTHEGDLYFDLRYIKLDASTFIVWRVDHRLSVPRDILDCFYGSPDEMRAFYARKQ